MSGLFEDLKPSGLWKHFEQILKIPHCSEDEKSCGAGPCRGAGVGCQLDAVEGADQSTEDQAREGRDI